MKKLSPFKILFEDIVYKDGERMSVVKSHLETPESREVDWTYIQTKNGVIIVAVDDKFQVYLKKEWRLNRKDFVWELPSGWIEITNPTPDEILDEANRELTEEVYLTAKKLKIIESFYPSNLLSGIFYIVLAQDLEISHGKRDENELIYFSSFPLEEIEEQVSRNQTPNAQTLVGINAAKRYLKI